MGDVLTAIKTMQTLKQETGGHGMPAPQLPQMADPASLMGSSQAQDFSQNGQSQAQPQSAMQAPEPQQAQGISMADLSSPLPVSAPSGADPSNPYAPMADTPKEVAEDVGNDKPPITVTGDAWKPSHESTLGRITDFMLQMKGHRPIIKDRHDQADAESAMSGFQDNPERSISRLSKVDPDAARQLYNSVASARAEQARTAYVNLQKLKTGGDIISGSLGAITNAPEGQRSEVYKRSLPTLQKLAGAAGYPSDLLPKEYDADAINTLRASGFTGYQQEQLNLHRKAIEDLSGYRGKRIDQIGSHQNAEEKNATRRTDIEQSRADKATRDEINVKTPHGIGTVSIDRNEMRLKDPGDPESIYIYKAVGPGNGPLGKAWRVYDHQKLDPRRSAQHKDK